MLIRKLLRMLRGKQASARSTTRLLVETLEDRLALSSTSLTHQLWRDTSFALDQGAVLKGSIQLQNTNGVRAAAMEGSTLIGLDRVFTDYTYRGTGYSVAVLDTGIDYNHTALGGGFGRRVIAGYDFVNNDSDPMDDNGHGTHVAGIIGSSDSRYTGVAPNVNLIALKVLDKSGSGSFGDVEDALRWVINNQARYNIVAINMSLGAGNYTSNPYTFLEDEFQSLKNQGVFIAAAAGNSFYSYNSAPGLGYAAISPLAVGVGAVWASNFGQVNWASGARDYTTAADRVTSFSQRSSAIDIFAPGALMTSTYLNGAFRSMAGTSMATPVVAGAAAILHQALDAAGRSADGNQDFIVSLMKSTGATIVDGDDENDNVNNTGLTFKRLNLHAALQSITVTNAAPVLQAIANQTMSSSQDSIVVTLNATDADGDALTYSARTSDSRVIAIVRGNQLTLDPAAGFGGVVQIDVTVSDGRLTSSGSFTLTVTNAAPTLNAIADQTMSADGRLTLSLSATDPEGDALTYSARVLPGKEHLAYQLDQQLNWTYDGSYYTDVRGCGEKYIRGNDGWYILMPNGEIYRWARSMPQTLQAQNLVGTFDASYYDDPSKLWDAKLDKPGMAYYHDQQRGWHMLDSYYHNVRGYNEKYIRGNDAWYIVMQDGSVYRWAGSMVQTLRESNLVATFDSSYWADPSLLCDARQSTSATVTVSGNQLTIQPNAGFRGRFLVEATVSDGRSTHSRTFWVNVQ